MKAADLQKVETSFVAFAILIAFKLPKTFLKPTTLFRFGISCAVRVATFARMMSMLAWQPTSLKVVFPTCVRSTSWSRSRRSSASENSRDICMMHRVNGA